VNSAIFIGKRVCGIAGAVSAALGVVLPAFLSILLVIAILKGLAGNKYVEKVFAGIKAASAGLILLAALKLGKSSVKGKMGWIIAVVSFAAIVFLDIHAAWVIIFGGICGFAAYLLEKRRSS
jgi:chromate transporter